MTSNAALVGVSLVDRFVMSTEKNTTQAAGATVGHMPTTNDNERKRSTGKVGEVGALSISSGACTAFASYLFYQTIGASNKGLIQTAQRLPAGNCTLYNSCKG